MTDYTTVNWPDATVVVSKKLQKYYQEKYKKNVEYIPNGAPEPHHLVPDGIHQWGLYGKDYILFAARLVPEKWCHGLINAYKRINNPRFPLVIAGDSNYGDQYAADLKKNASENIRFPGFVTGRLMQELYSNAYAYVLPSTIEGLSTGLLEAMSYGNCVLVSDIEENMEAIAGCGLTFRSGNENDLQEKLEDLMNQPQMVDSYREKARLSVQKEYNWESITDEFENLYKQLLSSSHPSSIGE
jgi:glycosyltransferase involved in cell wall biosynthesis